MRISGNNYNSLGRLGPHYERPEYRPPEKNDVGQKASRQELIRGDRSTLSTKNKSAALRKSEMAPTPLFSGKINLEQVRGLTELTSNMISGLSPLSTSRGPHVRLPSSLIAPRYV